MNAIRFTDTDVEKLRAERLPLGGVARNFNYYYYYLRWSTYYIIERLISQKKAYNMLIVINLCIYIYNK
jgi:hypothetical protein